MILPAITTTKGSDWREKIKEAEGLKIKEICFFLTCLNLDQRKEFYELVKKTSIKEAPFVHLRTDMEPWELDYLVENYKTKVFNIHTQSEFPLVYDYSKYKKQIYVENIYEPFDEKELKKFGGICLDFTHFENDRLTDEKKFRYNTEILKKYPIGCNHISAIKPEPQLDDYDKTMRYDKHFFKNLSEFDYLKKYPQKYFSNFIALELENSLEDQLLVRKFIEQNIISIV